jgi:hypothetical protein
MTDDDMSPAVRKAMDRFHAKLAERREKEAMTDLEDWHVRRKRYEAFMATNLGQSYRAYEKALIDYWRQDANEGLPSNKLMELDQISKETTHAFVSKLMELAGV